jgi:WD40 repeat protein
MKPLMDSSLGDANKVTSLDIS